MNTNTFIEQVSSWKFLTVELRDQLCAAADHFSEEERDGIITKGQKIGEESAEKLENTVEDMEQKTTQLGRALRAEEEAKDREGELDSLPNFDEV